MSKFETILLTQEAKAFLRSIGMTVDEARLYYSLYEKSKNTNIVTTSQSVVALETDSQKQYISSQGVATTYLLPVTFLSSQQKAFENLNLYFDKMNTGLDDFLQKELKYKTKKELDNAIMPVQKDAVAMFIRNNRSSYL
jgi:hypothetical protein